MGLLTSRSIGKFIHKKWSKQTKTYIIAKSNNYLKSVPYFFRFCFPRKMMLSALWVLRVGLVICVFMNFPVTSYGNYREQNVIGWDETIFLLCVIFLQTIFFLQRSAHYSKFVVVNITMSEKKLPPLCISHFDMHFRRWKLLNSK